MIKQRLRLVGFVVIGLSIGILKSNVRAEPTIWPANWTQTGGEFSPGGSGEIGATDLCDRDTNLALNQTATQSSENGFPAANAVDGNTGNFMLTAPGDPDSWWQVDLGSVQTVHQVLIYNRDAVGTLLTDNGGFCLQVLADDGVTEVARRDYVGTVYWHPFRVDLPGDGVDGRYVRISELDPAGDRMNLAEVEVYAPAETGSYGFTMQAGKENYALMGTPSQSTTQGTWHDRYAIDDDTGTSLFSHTATGDSNAWWQVDLGEDKPIDSVIVYDRDGNSHPLRLNTGGWELEIRNSGNSVVWSNTYPYQADFQRIYTADLSGEDIEGQVVLIRKLAPISNEYLCLAEVQVLAPTAAPVLQIDIDAEAETADALRVTGALTLTGTLRINLLGDAPSGDLEFDIFDWGSLSDTFNTIEFSGEGELNTDNLYTDGTIQLSAPLPLGTTISIR